MLQSEVKKNYTIVSTAYPTLQVPDFTNFLWTGVVGLLFKQAWQIAEIRAPFKEVNIYSLTYVDQTLFLSLFVGSIFLVKSLTQNLSNQKFVFFQKYEYD